MAWGRWDDVGDQGSWALDARLWCCSGFAARLYHMLATVRVRQPLRQQGGGWAVCESRLTGTVPHHGYLSPHRLSRCAAASRRAALPDREARSLPHERNVAPWAWRPPCVSPPGRDTAALIAVRPRVASWRRASSLDTYIGEEAALAVAQMATPIPGGSAQDSECVPS
eukprot:scaffold2188_cov388-Prasinococcus_capsulatus_cf.AAC.19